MPQTSSSIATLIASAKAKSKSTGGKRKLKLVGDELLAAVKANDGEALVKGIRNLMRISDTEED